METHPDSIQVILLILTLGFGLATLCGYLTERAKLSSLVGYLIAGYIIGPYSPGCGCGFKTLRATGGNRRDFDAFRGGLAFQMGGIIPG